MAKYVLAVLSMSFAFAWATRPAPACARNRPNIVWIVSEDNSKHFLKLFDPGGAPTPNIEKLAQRGVIFERAFSNAPVCSVARTTLATGVYGPRIGAQFHRKHKMVTLPDGWRLFPAYLRDAGYYTTNNSKKDYNVVEGKGVWDESSNKASWRKRPGKDTPFFHMESHGVSHESSLHFGENQVRPDALTTDPKTVALSPRHPDTELFRFTYARYHDRIRAVDGLVGSTVAKLEEDGLLEDTFIFYFGDHGGVLPGSKGYIYEVGLHVPLVVRVPEKFRHLVDRAPGSRARGFVSFIDFGPTALHLAGVKVPQHMDGRAFLGEGVNAAEVDARDETFGHADRFDEKYDLCRSLRKGKWKYIRNYHGFYPDALQNNYRYRMLAYEQWRSLYKEGNLNAAQRMFFERKPAEMLFDVEADPYEVKNVAGDPQHADVLRDMRARLGKRVRELPDLSFYPESVLVKEAVDDPLSFAAAHKAEIAQFADAADLCLLPFDRAEPKLEAAMRADSPGMRYWALCAASVMGKPAAPLADRARALLGDDHQLIRLRAAEFLAIIGEQDPRPVLKDILRTTDEPLVALLTLNSVVHFQDGKPGYDFNLKPNDVRAKSGEVQRRLEYLVRD